MVRQRIARIVGAGLVAGGLLTLPGLPASAVTDTFECTSSASESTTSYTITGEAPTTVVQGATFEVTNIVVTGTPDVPLWLEDIQFTFAASSGATPTGSMTKSFTGPAGTDPPGPPAPAGIPNSSPAMSLVLVADGAVGETVDFSLVNVSATAVEIGAPEDREPRKLDVSCSNAASLAFASTLIIAREEPTVTTLGEVVTTTTACEPGAGSCTSSTTLGEPTTTNAAPSSAPSSSAPSSSATAAADLVATTAAGATSLPFTGRSSGPLAITAFASVVAGLGLLALARPRQHLAGNRRTRSEP